MITVTDKTVRIAPPWRYNVDFAERKEVRRGLQNGKLGGEKNVAIVC